LPTASPASIRWSQFHFFWGDERCVSPDNPESNFGVANRLWLSKIDIPSSHVHRIQGEAEPTQEASRYAEEIRNHLIANETSSGSSLSAIPQFDLVLLGMGADGHTASIFPDRLDVLDSPNFCEVVQHPISGQFRITITGQVINRASRVVFLITGADKAEVLRQVVEQADNFRTFPAAYVRGPQVEFFLDSAAAARLDRSLTENA
jgi:6-phosphogluconolactonase